MSYVTHDLRCTADPALLPPKAHFECRVLYRRSDGPPPCPTCGAPRVVFYATREMEGAAALDRLDATLAQFGTVLLDGKRMTREEMTRFKEKYAENQGIDPKTIDFVGIDYNRKERADFYRHRSAQTHLAAGFDEKARREYQREQRERSIRG